MENQATLEYTNIGRKANFGAPEMTVKGQHVVPRDGRWSVRKTGADRATRTFDTQSEAEKEARRIARNQHTEVYIHGRDGRIRERASYGRESVPDKG